MQPTIALPANPNIHKYELTRLAVNTAEPERLTEWMSFLRRSGSNSPRHDPLWLKEQFRAPPGASAVLLREDNSIRGLSVFTTRDWPLRLQLGEVTAARLPLRRLCILEGDADFPQDTQSYDLLFSHLLSSGATFDAIYLESLAVESPFWRYLETSPLIAKAFSRYLPEPPSARVLLRLTGSFDDYLSRFSSKHRATLRRKVRKFEDCALGETLLRITRPEQVESFVEQAVTLSKKTYQWALLGLGLRSAEALRESMRFRAENGWLRSYLLISAGRPCAFLTGYQYGDRYYLDDMGYDPEWREFSVGTVLQMKLIEDLFVHDRPEIYDLGEFGPHKEEFATESHQQGKVLLFRRGIYNSLARLGHRSCLRATANASAVLERYGVKSRLKTLIRKVRSKP
jgi:hypothetical protein